MFPREQSEKVLSLSLLLLILMPLLMLKPEVDIVRWWVPSVRRDLEFAHRSSLKLKRIA